MQPLPQGGPATDATHSAVPDPCADAAGQIAIHAAAPKVPHALV